MFEIRFACPCGADHASLVTHDQLDWQPLGTAATAFYDVMTGRYRVSRRRAGRGSGPPDPARTAGPGRSSARRRTALAPSFPRRSASSRHGASGCSSQSAARRVPRPLSTWSRTAISTFRSAPTQRSTWSTAFLTRAVRTSSTELVEELRGAPLACTRHRLEHRFGARSLTPGMNTTRARDACPVGRDDDRGVTSD